MQRRKGRFIDQNSDVNEWITRLRYSIVFKQLKEIWDCGRTYVSDYCKLCKYCYVINSP